MLYSSRKRIHYLIKCAFPKLTYFWEKKIFSFLPSVSHATNQSLAFLIFPEVFLFFKQHAGLRLSSEFHHSHEIGPFPRNGMDIQNSEKFFLVKNVVLGSCDKIFYICISYMSLFSGPSIQIYAYFILINLDYEEKSKVYSNVLEQLGGASFLRTQQTPKRIALGSFADISTSFLLIHQYHQPHIC